MQNPLYSHRSEDHWRGELDTKDGSLGGGRHQFSSGTSGEPNHGACLKITVGGIAKHTRDDTPLLECLQVVPIRAARPSAAKCIHVGS